MEKKIKCKIVKRCFIVAIDEDGNTYKVPDVENSEEVIFKSIEGIAKVETKQDRYSDGSYARSESEIRTFTFH